MGAEEFPELPVVEKGEAVYLPAGVNCEDCGDLCLPLVLTKLSKFCPVSI